MIAKGVFVQRLLQLLILVGLLDAAFGIELVEKRDWHLPFQASPVSIAPFEGSVLLSAGNEIYRVLDDGNLGAFDEVSIVHDHLVIDMDYRSGRLAHISGYLGFGSELFVTDLAESSIRSLVAYLSDGELPAIRQATWISDNDLLIEMFRPDGKGAAGTAGLYRFNLSLEEMTTILEAPDLRLIATTPCGNAFLVQTFGAGVELETFVLSDVRRPVTGISLIVNGTGVSATDFVVQGIDGLYALTVLEDSVKTEKLETWIQNVSSMDFSPQSASLYIVSDPPGSGMLLTEYFVRP
jgi:hypothetical protein